MKKFMSVLIAVIMMLGIAMPAFAASETEVKNVDNTFDNFTPGIDKRAPENWYDPYCYESDGTMKTQALTVSRISCAYYCKEYKRIYTHARLGITPEGYTYYPYLADGEIPGPEGMVITTSDYCPYCGVFENFDGRFKSNHKLIDGVLIGWFCSECNGFNTRYGMYDKYGDRGLYIPVSCMHCNHYETPEKLYRFITDEQRSAEFSNLFTETEYQYGDGKDGRVEDIKFDRDGFAKYWSSPDNPISGRLSFWQKIAVYIKDILNIIINRFSTLF